MTTKLELVISKNHINSLRKHACNSIPNESCALLFGKNENTRFLTEEILLTENVEKSPTSFTISNDELLIAYEQAEKKKLEIIGIFHSHPNSIAYPSETDQKYMKINPVPWIIFSNITDDFRAYILESTIVPLVMKVL